MVIAAFYACGGRGHVQEESIQVPPVNSYRIERAAQPGTKLCCVVVLVVSCA